jgi:hypothetical protein
VTIPPLQISNRVATAVNQAKRLSQRANDVDLCATFVRFDYSPVGVGADWAGFAAGFSVFGAPGGGTVPGVGPTGASPGGRWVAGGAFCVPANSARSFNQL